MFFNRNLVMSLHIERALPGLQLSATTIPYFPILASSKITTLLRYGNLAILMKISCNIFSVEVIFQLSDSDIQTTVLLQ